MEAVRPQVDAYLLDWLTREPLKREWFFEQRDGNCRLMASLAVRLSETAPTWGRAVAPFAEWVAQTLRTPHRKRSQQRSDRTDTPDPTTKKRGARKRVRSRFANCTEAARRFVASVVLSLKRGQLLSVRVQLQVSREKIIALGPVATSSAQSEKAQKARTETQKIHAAADSGLDRFRKSNHRLDWKHLCSRDSAQACFCDCFRDFTLALRISEPYARRHSRGPMPPASEALAGAGAAGQYSVGQKTDSWFSSGCV